MRRLSPGRCGYLGYVCKGLPKILLLLLFISDTVVYKGEDRPNDNNYFNIPTQFLGVIHSTPFYDLLGISKVDIPLCFFDYNPFLTDGLFDFAERLSDRPPMDEYKLKLKLYSTDILLKPGILRPRAKLSEFNIPSTVTIPDTAIPVVFPINSVNQVQALVSPYVSAIQAIQAQVAALEGHTPTIQAVQAQVATLEGLIPVIQAVQAQVATLEGQMPSIQAVQAQVASLEGYTPTIQAIQAQVAALEGHTPTIQAVQAQVATLEGLIPVIQAVQAQVATLEGLIPVIQAVQAQVASLEGHTPTIQAVQAQVAALEGLIPAIQAVQAQVAALLGQMPSIQAIQAQVAAVASGIAAIEAQASIQQISIDKSNVIASRSSGCSNGFIISVHRKTGARYYIEVSEGLALVGVDLLNKATILDVPLQTSQLFGPSQIEKMLVWLQATLNIYTRLWTVTALFINEDNKNTDINKIKPWSKRVLLGTIQHVLMVNQIDQALCSPVDMRDWASLLAASIAGDARLYVFYMDKDSGKKGWLPVKDC